jgi:hypothetical protein
MHNCTCTVKTVTISLVFTLQFGDHFFLNSNSFKPAIAKRDMISEESLLVYKNNYVPPLGFQDCGLPERGFLKN